ncbi:MAG: hypothetical protein A3F74_21355 [Betaproteobacteria bacterium RIFCSPLOWO2_12_FULL_62_58]|nr:MAG: hypothetical protein A3I62_02845 [Betaproteobacteria bacterium RIFCSPLOWO2_02_FULL_62_79]OGA48462.1 MAG: hypothetical protein A3F74_21355 [Betaproteobacteria bacterium RIFCSPLOWO2_12_FULL_62_58]
MRKQEGLTLTGFMVWAVMLVFAALLVFKIGPAYMDYFTLQKTLKVVASDPTLQSGQRQAIENAFQRRADVEYISAVSPSDLQIEKDGDQLVISIEYAVRVPLFANMSICLDFNASSAK